MKGIKRPAIVFCALAAALMAVNITNGSRLSDIGLSVSVSAATVSGISYVDYAGGSHTVDTCTVVDNSTTWGINNTETWYVLNTGKTISNRITVKGIVNLILSDNCTLSANNGIRLPNGATLIIWSQKQGTGALTATASTSTYAGIGGNGNDTAGTIIINGGIIKATGGSSGGAGIGGGQYGKFTKIQINGGSITANGKKYAAGIGAGGGVLGDVGSRITINGGTIDAHGGSSAMPGGSKANDVGNSADYNRDHHLSGGGYGGTVIRNESAFTVTIPEAVQVGTDCSISAANVSVSEGKSLKVTVSSEDIDDNSFIMKYETDNSIYLKYRLMDGDVERKSGDTILSVSSTETGGSSSLSTVLDDTPVYSGKYTGTLTFNISVE